jgi:two-component system, LytTR family, response regulator
MMRVLIVDDEPLARSGIRTRLLRYTDVTGIEECSDGEEAIATLNDRQIDLVFMDVQMPGLHGLDVLRQLPPTRRPLAIMLTAYDHYALSAFEVNVLDYLLKPVDDTRFEEAMTRARDMLKLRGRPSTVDTSYVKRFAARIGHRDIVVEVSAIDWIEAQGDYVGIHAGEKIYLVRETMHDVIGSLDPREFTRIHRSAIVRLDRIAEIEALTNKDCMIRLRNGKVLRASRSHAHRLKAALACRMPA